MERARGPWEAAAEERGTTKQRRTRAVGTKVEERTRQAYETQRSYKEKGSKKRAEVEKPDREQAKQQGQSSGPKVEAGGEAKTKEGTEGNRGET